MPRILKFISFLLFLFLLASCQFTEKMDVKENGSGTYSLNIDMSGMLKAMNTMGDSTNTANKDPKKMDSLIDFNSFLIEKKDSISKLSKEDQEKLNGLKDMKMHILMNEATDKLDMDFIFEFKNMSDLKNIQDKISKGQTVNNKNSAPSPKSPTDVKFKFNGKKFHRIIVDKPLSQEEKEAYNLSLQQGASMLQGSTYNIEYHFAKPIKSTTYKGATFSADRKTLFIKSDLNTVTSNPKLLDFEIILE